LYYPIIVAGITFIVGSLLLKETKHVLIWNELDTIGSAETEETVWKKL
jgi:hypothetical protein